MSLSEYARYLHAHLDMPLVGLNLDNDLSAEFKERWIKTMPFQFEVTSKRLLRTVFIYFQNQHMKLAELRQ